MKFHLLLFALLFSISVFGQKMAPAKFSLTDKRLAGLVAESKNVNLEIEIIRSDGETVEYNIPMTLEYYYNTFLRSVYDLRETVLFKNTLVKLPKENPEFSDNPGIRQQVSEIYFQKVYGSYQYSDFYNYMKKSMEILREKVNNPDLTVFQREVFYDENIAKGTEADRKKMLTDAEKIYMNLTNIKNAEQNQKHAKEGVDYYRQIMSGK